MAYSTSSSTFSDVFSIHSYRLCIMEVHNHCEDVVFGLDAPSSITVVSCCLPRSNASVRDYVQSNFLSALVQQCLQQKWYPFNLYLLNKKIAHSLGFTHLSFQDPDFYHFCIIIHSGRMTSEAWKRALHILHVRDGAIDRTISEEDIQQSCKCRRHLQFSDLKSLPLRNVLNLREVRREEKHDDSDEVDGASTSSSKSVQEPPRALEMPPCLHEVKNCTTGHCYSRCTHCHRYGELYMCCREQCDKQACLDCLLAPSRAQAEVCSHRFPDEAPRPGSSLCILCATMTSCRACSSCKALLCAACSSRHGTKRKRAELEDGTLARDVHQSLCLDTRRELMWHAEDSSLSTTSLRKPRQSIAVTDPFLLGALALQPASVFLATPLSLGSRRSLPAHCAEIIAHFELPWPRSTARATTLILHDLVCLMVAHKALKYSHGSQCEQLVTAILQKLYGDCVPAPDGLTSRMANTHQHWIKRPTTCATCQYAMSARDLWATWSSRTCQASELDVELLASNLYFDAWRCGCCKISTLGPQRFACPQCRQHDALTVTEASAFLGGLLGDEKHLYCKTCEIFPLAHLGSGQQTGETWRDEKRREVPLPRRDSGLLSSADWCSTSFVWYRERNAAPSG